MIENVDTEFQIYEKNIAKIDRDLSFHKKESERLMSQIAKQKVCYISIASIFNLFFAFLNYYINYNLKKEHEWVIENLAQQIAFLNEKFKKELSFETSVQVFFLN
jgi:hypothetical protein